MATSNSSFGYVVDLGKVGFLDGVNIQKKILELRMQQKICDTLLVAQHPPTISLGVRVTPEYLEKRLKVPLDELESEYGMHISRDHRGGFETYLGPGQITVYPILNMSQLNKRLNHIVKYPNFKPEASINLIYMYFLEEAMIQTLNYFGVLAFRRQDWEEATGHRHIGVYVDKDGDTYQIGAAGVKLQSREGEHYTMFGSSLYVRDDDFYELVNPCGYEDVLPITMESLLDELPDYNEVKRVAIQKFAEIFHYELESKYLKDILES